MYIRPFSFSPGSTLSEWCSKVLSSLLFARVTLYNFCINLCWNFQLGNSRILKIKTDSSNWSRNLIQEVFTCLQPEQTETREPFLCLTSTIQISSYWDYQFLISLPLIMFGIMLAKVKLKIKIRSFPASCIFSNFSAFVPIFRIAMNASWSWISSWIIRFWRVRIRKFLIN